MATIVFLLLLILLLLLLYRSLCRDTLYFFVAYAARITSGRLRMIIYKRMRMICVFALVRLPQQVFYC